MILSTLILSPERTADYPVHWSEPGVVLPAGKDNGSAKLKELQNGESRDVILDLAMESLAELYDGDTHRFDLRPRWIPNNLLRTQPSAITEVRPEGAVERYTSFSVTVKDGNRTRTTQIQLAVDMERRLPVAGRRIMNGESLTESDLQMSWVSVPTDRGQLVSKIEELTGKTVRRNLAQGQPIRHADVGSEYIIEGGDSIRIIYEESGVRIELTGEARQSGGQDDEIRVYSNETRKRYLGRVTGPGVVTWLRTL